MPESKRERILNGESVEARDSLKIAQVRSDIAQHARIRKGLPREPLQLDASAISQLTEAPIIEGENNFLDEPTKKIVDISTLRNSDSRFGFETQKKRLEKKAA